MSASPTLGAPVVDIEEHPPTAISRPRCRLAEPAVAEPVEGGSWGHRIAILLATVALLVATVALVLRPGHHPAGATTSALPPPGLGGYAELYVATWLTSGGEDAALDLFLPGGADLSAMQPRQRYVTRAATVEVIQHQPRLWTVTVAADVLELVDGGYVPAGLEHYQVGIAVDGIRFAALGLPARVAAPEPARFPASLLALDEPLPDSLLATTTGFLEALLTGDGNLSRFAAAGSGISPVDPPPYTRVDIVASGGCASGSAVVLRVTVDATTGGGRTHIMDYTLEASEASGVWEILAMIPAVTAEEAAS